MVTVSCLKGVMGIGLRTGVFLQRAPEDGMEGSVNVLFLGAGGSRGA